jgi:hypothetical protein
VGTEASANTPSFIATNLGSTNIGVRRAFGAFPDEIVIYERPSGDPWGSGADHGGGATVQRPFHWLAPINSFSEWSTIYLDKVSGQMRDLATGTQELFGDAGPVGQPTAMTTSSGTPCAYFRATNNRIQESCWYNWGGGDTEWLGWQLVGQTWTATTSPIAFNGARDASCRQDHIVYGCGTVGTTRACVYTISGGGTSESSTLFGSGSFLDGTRPTGLTLPGGALYLFAVTLNGNTKSLMVGRQTNGFCSGTPGYELTTLESTTSAVTFSSPMPYVRTDGKLAIVYFKTTSGQTTRVMERVLTGLTWSAATQIDNTDVTIPVGGGEPVAASNGSLSIPNTVVYHKPSSLGGYRDIVQLTASGASYVKSTIPPDVSGLFIVKAGASGRLHEVNKRNGAFVQSSSDDWTSATSFTTDGASFGYGIKSNNLYKVNLDTGARSTLGSAVWTGTTKIAYGLEHSTGTPKLWVLQGDTLYKVNVSTGARTALTSGWTGSTSLAYLSYDSSAEDLFIIQGVSIWRVNSNTGTWTNLNDDNWTGNTTSGAFVQRGHMYSNMLFIVQNSHLHRVDPSSGNYTVLGGASWPATTGVAELRGRLYAIDSNVLCVINTETGTWQTLGGSNWTGTTFLGARDWTLDL